MEGKGYRKGPSGCHTFIVHRVRESRDDGIVRLVQSEVLLENGRQALIPP